MIAHQQYWDDVPRFGSAARRWLRRSLYVSAQSWLTQHTKINPEGDESAPVLAAMVRSLAAPGIRIEFLRWQDYKEFRGRGYASGEWKINAAALAPSLQAAFDRAIAEDEATRYPTLDAWLSALHAGQLVGTAPAERSGGHLLAGDGWRSCRHCDELFRPEPGNAVRCPSCRRATEQRQCRVCGREFAAKPEVYSVTCPVCKAEKRQRCLDCKGIFEVASHKVKRCPECRRRREVADA